MDESHPIFKARAYAKVNLALAVDQAQSDIGLHPICSWMHAIDLFDEIIFSVLDMDQESRYQVEWADDPGFRPVEWAIEDDLAVRMHRLVESRVGHRLPIDLRVKKRIPAGGGLGGGSADAAVLLRGLNTTFELNMSDQSMAGLALALGSDIPFFLDGDRACVRPGVVKGVGDQIRRLETNHAGTRLTLFMPALGCSTGQVYRAFDQIHPDHSFIENVHRIEEIAQSVSIDQSVFFNDLELPAMRVAPVLGDLKAEIEERIGQRVHVSGSGSTLFLIGEIDSERVGLEGLGIRMIQTCLI